MPEKQQLTLMQLTSLAQEVRLGQPEVMGEGLPGADGGAGDGKHAAELGCGRVPVGGECPYPGLAAFRPQERGVFFGREEEVAALAARLAELCVRPGLLAVIGPSGRGSPRCCGQGCRRRWRPGRCRCGDRTPGGFDLTTPGRRPLLELATRVAALAGIPAGGLEADLRADPDRIAAAVRQAMLAHARRLMPPGLGADVSAAETGRGLLVGIPAAAGNGARRGPGDSRPGWSSSLTSSRRYSPSAGRSKNGGRSSARWARLPQPGRPCPCPAAAVPSACLIRERLLRWW